MIHPTRTDLLQLRETVASVANSVAILKARRQALIKAFLDAARPFLRSRDAIRDEYAGAIVELQLAKGHEGQQLIEALAASAERDVGADVVEKRALGVPYRELTIWGPFVRSPEQRDYGYELTTPHLEESLCRFERVVESVLAVAAFESRLQTLGNEIRQVTRRTRVLEERVLPRLRADIKAISQYIGEREREAHFRLKQFKARRSRGGASAPPGRRRLRPSDAAARTDG